MSTLKVINLQHPSNANNNVVLDANGNMTVVGSVISNTPTSFRNRIINGDFKIWQRGTSFTSITTSLNTADRSTINAGNLGTGVFSLSRSTDVPVGQGFTYSANLACTTTGTVSTGNFISFDYNMESLIVSDLAYGTSNAKTMTLSFWVKSNLTGTLPGNIAQVQNSNRVFPYYFTINAANTWQKVTIVIPGDTDASAVNALPVTNVQAFQMNLCYFQIGTQYQFGTANIWNNNGSLNAWIPSGQTYINGASSTSNYLLITGVQLEVGSAATPFEFRHYPIELMMCQRYFQIYSQPMLRGVCTGAAAGRMGMTLPVVMRAAPTAVVGALPIYDGTATTTVSGVQVAYLATDHVEFDFTLAATLTGNRPCMVYTAGNSTMTLTSEF